MQRIVVVGASLAGLRSAQELPKCGRNQLAVMVTYHLAQVGLSLSLS